MLPIAFTNNKTEVVYLEHSLYAISLWEEKYEKPFLTNDEKSEDELYYYLSCMNRMEPNSIIDERKISVSDFEIIKQYIEGTHSATFFREDKKATKSTKVITAELLYAWMAIGRIPYDPAQHWHINRLLNTIKAVDAEQNPPKEKTTKEQVMEYRALNAKRKAEMAAKKGKKP